MPGSGRDRLVCRNGARHRDRIAAAVSSRHAALHQPDPLQPREQNWEIGTPDRSEEAISDPSAESAIYLCERLGTARLLTFP
jgi:hypothetical protein